ncbi:MAG: ComF family protein [Clostridia bacterium]|nr:ComF family protein [Clostridia bacterium]
MIKLIFPPKCIFCGNLLEIQTEVEICSFCYEKIPFVKEAIIEVGNMPFIDHFLDGVVCTCQYTGIIKDSLQKYKFQQKSGYFRALGFLLAKKVKEVTSSIKFDIIISVPLHHSKESARGYNQSRLIASVLSRQINVAEKSTLISRVKNTESQSLLKRTDRFQNINNAFAVNHPESIKDKTILLIDDILTTGATLNECGKILKMAGAKAVFAAVIATGRNINS